MTLSRFIFTFFAVIFLTFVSDLHAREMMDYPIVKLRSLDKVTARTITFEASVGSTLKFGSLYIKAQACRKAPPIEQPEAAAFLQVWEITPEDKSEWVYSGWMFASSPGLAHMDHPVYDVWVLDCLEDQFSDEVILLEDEGQIDEKQNDEGIVAEDQIPLQPQMTLPH